MPSESAFCLKDPSLRFISFDSFDTGVRDFECALINLTSAAEYSFRDRFELFAFFAICRLHCYEGVSLPSIGRKSIFEANDVFSEFPWLTIQVSFCDFAFGTLFTLGMITGFRWIAVSY